MDSEEEALEDLEFDGSSDGDDGIDEDILDALEEDLAAAAAAEASEMEDSDTDDTDNGSDDDDDGDDEQPPPPPIQQPEPQLAANEPSGQPRTPSPPRASPFAEAMDVRTPTPPPAPVPRERSLSPAGLRRSKLLSNLTWPRSFTVEAICAIPHPAPTHCLASSLCMSHLLTGSDDGYIRDYDIFAGVNGKIFLTAPQRHHCGVMEGLMKAAQIRCWWENPGDVGMTGHTEDPPLCAPYSMCMQSDALWSLAGTDQGHINLFTVRHEPGRLAHVLRGHRGPVSSLSLQHDEKGVFSAGWDGEAIQWDLNTGQTVRNFTSHGAQLAAIGVRPLESEFTGIPWIEQREAALERSNMIKQEQIADGHPPSVAPQSSDTMRDDDEKSDFDPLFDDEPDADGDFNMASTIPQTLPAPAPQVQPPPPQASPVKQDPMPAMPTANPFAQQRVSTLPRNAPNAPPVLDPLSYAGYSPDILMTASIDGQVILWDRRVHSPGVGVGRLPMSEKTRPWCVSACWSADGSQIYVGRRNATIDVWDVRLTGQAHIGTPRVLKQLRNPAVSGDVSCVVAFPDGRHLACASNDNIRLWNVAEAGEPDAWGKMKSGVQFKIIPGHHGGVISQMLVDRRARFLVSASSHRGWHGESTKTVFVHEVKSIW